MTNEWLVEMIQRFNDGALGYSAALRGLSDTVVLAYVWSEEPRGETPQEASSKLYFIMNSGRAIGVVYDMCDAFPAPDLHWLMLEEHRKQGHLHRALHSCILPHLFEDEREEIVATANSKSNAEYAMRQGFTLVDPPTGEWPELVHLRLRASDIDCSVVPVGVNHSLDNDRIAELKRRLRKAKGLIRSVSEEVACAYGKRDWMCLEELSAEIESAATRLSDLNLLADRG